MAEETEVKIVIKAEDKATPVIRKTQKSVEDLDNGYKQIKKTITQMKDGMQTTRLFQKDEDSLRKQITTVNGVAKKYTEAFRKVKEVQQKQSSIPKAPKMPESTGADIGSEFFGKVKLGDITGANEMQKANEAIEKGTRFFNTISNKSENLSNQLKELNDRMDGLKQKFYDLSVAGDSTKLVEMQMRSLKTQIDNTSEALKQSKSGYTGIMKTLTSLWSRIKRVVSYRLIRGFIKIITQGVVEGINRLVKESDKANEVMSKYMNSFNQLKNAVAAVLIPILEILQPIVLKLTDYMIRFANAISVAFAQLSGQATFMKAIALMDDYSDSINKANKQLLDFDKFSVLRKDTSSTTVNFEEANVSENVTGLSTTLATIMEMIKNIITWVGKLGISLESVLIVIGIIEGVKIISRLVTIVSVMNPIVLAITAIVAALALLYTTNEDVRTSFDNFGKSINGLFTTIKPFISVFLEDMGKLAVAVMQVLNPLLDTITALINWDFKGVLKGLIGMANGILNLFSTLIENFVNQTIIRPINWILEGVNKLTGKDWKIGELDIPDMNIQLPDGYANGGIIPNKGSLFMANENGNTEVVTSGMSGSSTGVMNLEQWAQVSYNAFSRALRDNQRVFQSGEGDVYMDSTKVGKLVYDEFVRTGRGVKL